MENSKNKYNPNNENLEVDDKNLAQANDIQPEEERKRYLSDFKVPFWRKYKSRLNNIITIFLIPYIICYSLYIQIFGEVAPGGGFQAGAIFVSAFIAYDVSVSSINFLITSHTLTKIAAGGVLLYSLTGVYSLIMGENFLNFKVFGTYNPQAVGIILIEFGVGITVASVLLLLYMEVRNAS